MDISDELAESSLRLPQRSVDRPRVRCVSKKKTRPTRSRVSDPQKLAHCVQYPQQIPMQRRSK